MSIEERERDFKNQVNRMIAFPFEMRQEFILYWTEPNKPGTKMRWELEKTWDLNRRLLRWQRNGKDEKTFNGKQATNGHAVVPKPDSGVTIKEISDLDALLAKYRQHPTEVPFTSLGRFYPYMKQEKLLKAMYPAEIDELKEVFKGDNEKCRCACVQKTLEWYADKNWTFSDTMTARLKLTQ